MSDFLLLQYENKIGTISAAAESRQAVGQFIRAGEQLLKQRCLSYYEQYLLLDMTGRMMEMLLGGMDDS
jgi:hypothetical protein